ncbi:hypothetical protein [Rhizohabitans arisaemae]|uniref:hypothetical protein n=1 Tax=Rhizohabitans arisaemae TaxID=2720610 RepID=UPI0024B12000|nr:hypothetical protein [Rhizohabitans arisaemae]
MRAPKRRRPLLRSIVAPPEGVSLDEIAEKVAYVGSGEHKSYPSFAGHPRLRADASKCDPKFTDPEEITGWLRKTIANGNIGAPWEGGFPRYAWHRQDDVIYEARLVNRELGQYKGYPLERSEWPERLNEAGEDGDR